MPCMLMTKRQRNYLIHQLCKCANEYKAVGECQKSGVLKEKTSSLGRILPGPLLHASKEHLWPLFMALLEALVHKACP
ncbi:hypothetical protein JHK85_053745 [Glycine max]|nr:hypothetical protein JHK85_053745 [Glycine max]